MGETFLNVDCSSANSDCSSSENGSPQTCPQITFPVPGHLQQIPDGDQDTILLLERRSFRPFKSSQDYLYAMREDLAEWLNGLYGLDISVDNFFEKLENGVIMCQHANNVKQSATEHEIKNGSCKKFSSKYTVPLYEVFYRKDSAPGSFFARDNVHNFIRWCRDLGVHDVLMFETDDLVLRKNEKHVILALLEIARRGARFGMPAPLLVQMEEDIDREIEKDRLAQENNSKNALESHGSDTWGHQIDQEEEKPPNLIYGPQPQVVTNDLLSLDDMVRDLVARCSCPSQFPMIKVSEGKYRIGDTKVLIFVRILRNHVMVRVGGGWDTLHHYLDKHDPCRCKSGHRATISSKVGFKIPSSGERLLSSVTYERSEEGFQTSPMLRRKTNGLRRDVLDGKQASLRQRSKSPSCRENISTLARNGFRHDEGKSLLKLTGKRSQDHSYSNTNGMVVSRELDHNGHQLGFSPYINGFASKPPSAVNSICKNKPSVVETFLQKKPKSKSLSGVEPYFHSGESEFKKSKSSVLDDTACLKISRSLSTTSMNGSQTNFGKDYHNHMHSRFGSKALHGKSTWNGRYRPKEYSFTSSSDSNKYTNSVRSVRSASASPGVTRKTYSFSTPTTPCSSPKKSAPNHLSSSTSNSPLPPKLLSKLTNFDGDDTEVLAQLEGFVNNYRAYVLDKLAAEGRSLPPELADDDWCKAEENLRSRDIKYSSLKATPRKAGLGSRIPAPVF